VQLGALDESHKIFISANSELIMKSTNTQSKLSLSKVTLEKSGDKISLEKPSNAAGHGRIVCNLNWATGNNQKKGFLGGLFSKKTEVKNIDLDLCCLYELSNGQKSVVQALGKLFGSFEKPPYIHLAGDDRTGESVDGEFLYINGDQLNEIRRICIFTYIYDGVVNWSQANAVVTVSVPEHPIIEVRLDSKQNNLGTCAIAMLENSGGELKLTKLNRYFKGHRELDKHYKWGINWGGSGKKANYSSGQCLLLQTN
jgi:tellurite resistance protein TerA